MLSYNVLDSRKNSGLKIIFLLPVFLRIEAMSPHRNRGFDNHNGVRIVLHRKIYNSFNCTGIEVLRLTVIVGRSCDNHKIRCAITSSQRLV